MKPGLRALTVGFLAAFLIATAGTGIALHMVTLGTIARLVDRRIENVSAIVGRDPRATVVLARIAALSQRRDTGDIGFLLADAHGRRLGGNIDVRRRFAPGYAEVRSRDRIAGLSAGRAYTRRIGGDLTLTTIAETEPFDGYRAARLRIYLFGFGSIVLIVLGGLVVFAVTIARRFAETRCTVDAIVAGDMRRRVPVIGTDDEFDRHAIAFNRMLDQIAGLMDGLRNVSNDVAHDLRTPLARLRARLAAIATRSDDADIAAAIEDCDRILAMFAAMLRIAEVEAGLRVAGFVPFDLAVVASDVCEALAPVAEDGDRTLRWRLGNPLPMRGDPRLVEQMLVNAIENALRHTPPGTTIWVEGMATGDRAVLAVRDDGPGIPADQHALVLRRFGRLEASRNRPGHGLGLPLVAAIVRLHGGTLALEDGEPGLTLRLAFPA
ncbi:signal transduction histidine kinase [Sphingomonas insulae]|uniref:histidine kinase n=1 Tax=Sphingomonas insulae TaxID=424800 RepID=A0ABP3T230_9SPHN|nr:HAMP domain-containing sensor histidine kinase [Sphingomonas insulae]NIJ28804.1 signal transduction histidine kinase [Sphingomonas insulae]